MGMGIEGVEGEQAVGRPRSNKDQTECLANWLPFVLL